MFHWYVVIVIINKGEVMSRLICFGNYYNAQKPFVPLFKEVVRLAVDTADFKFKKGDVLLLGGGEDISPKLYKQKPSRYTGARAVLSDRDMYEKNIFEIAVAAGVPTIGICRGAQLVCALSGGSLYQHVTNHGVTHDMTTNEGTVLSVSSVHHQMMNPIGAKHELLAWSTNVRSNVHLIEDEQNLEVEVEPEVIYFKDTKALGIQYHPEFMGDYEAGVGYARNLVATYLMKG